MTDFQGRVAIVTGGSRGIGRAIVRDLAERGAAVVFTYATRDDRARSVEEETATLGRQAVAVRADSADFDAVKRMVGETQERFGRLDFLVNNAGITLNKLLMATDRKEWRQVVEVNLDGVFHFSRAAITSMMKAKRGAIVNVTSVSGVIGLPGQSAYAASKAGIIGFTKALAREVAPLGVRVNALALGFVETDMLSSLTEKRRTEATATVPMGRFGTPQEAAHATAFLLSEEASYVTGHVLHADGGLAA
jgi:3-oxoacyl-[acyl-carrier protein] reductase